jgi:CheY-like chemotaxis protein
VIVDDEPDVVEGLKMLLELDGYDVFPATNAEMALLLVSHHSPVGVIMDLGMPGMDGLELARRLRTLYGNDLPLIALTGWSDQAELEKAELAGVDCVLLKPIDGETLRRLLPPVKGNASSSS